VRFPSPSLGRTATSLPSVDSSPNVTALTGHTCELKTGAGTEMNRSRAHRFIMLACTPQRMFMLSNAGNADLAPSARRRIDDGRPEGTLAPLT
jgi:hypothetical protein